VILVRLLGGLTGNSVRTRPDNPDPRLQGRTYAVPFDVVWHSSVMLAGGGLRGWSIKESDDIAGFIRAESRTLVFRFVDDVEVRITLDENAQTRVDLSSSSRVGRADFGTNARRVGRFLKTLDRTLGAGPEDILDPRQIRFVPPPAGEGTPELTEPPST
jgi:hypothetical protein